VAQVLLLVEQAALAVGVAGTLAAQVRQETLLLHQALLILTPCKGLMVALVTTLLVQAQEVVVAVEHLR
jgi:hypothetical protein